MGILYRFMRPALFALPPEWAHDLILYALNVAGTFLPAARHDASLLQIKTLGHHFSNPFGLAAGFDKDARVLRGIAKLGFGFAEVGTSTPKPQFGNPRPRLYRLTSESALINRMGFNNQGQLQTAMRLALWQQKPRQMRIGVNIGANRDTIDKIDDYRIGAACFAELADYLVLNISSPNTPGLRDLQGDVLSDLLDAVCEVAPKIPVLIKIAPDIDMPMLEAVAKTILEKPASRSCAGVIISNTTVSRPPLTAPRTAHYREAGGLSGAPLAPLALTILRRVRALTSGRCVLIAAGGIMDGADAYARIRAGASLLQLYTGLIYYGPDLIVRLKRELAQYLRRDGFTTLEAAIGVDVDGQNI